MPAASATGASNVVTSSRTSLTSTGSVDRLTRPASIREMSSTSLMSDSRWRPATWIWSTLDACSAGSSSISSSWAKPRMALSGVRSSWLIRDRNSLLAWLARSAPNEAWRSDCSRCIRSVTSREMVTVPVTRPLWSKTGRARVS